MTADEERLARFDREARLLASLSHPNIGVIHGLEDSDGAPCLVLELIPGETLAERIAAGPLPLEEAVGVCRQIARALEAAHQNGVLHRDLKPANIKITPDGTVKVLDFGLAKAFSAEGSSGVSHSPTITTGGTRDGVLLGTAAYMSPEQARGKPLDARTDVWSFGCVLYEALTGERAFPGDSVPDILAAVIHREPDWTKLPASTPAGVRRLLERCLRKDRDRRLHSVADARLELEEPWPAHDPAREEAARRPSRRRAALPWALAGLFALAAVAAVWIRDRQREAAVEKRSYRLQVALPPGEKLAVDFRPALAMSPDGSLLAYAAERGGVSRLYVRPLEETAAALLPGTEGASEPFFSPDGKWIGFFAEGKLKKVPSAGGTPATLCEATSGRGAAWLDDDTIVFTPNTRSGLSSVSAAGGVPQELTRPDDIGQYDHRWAEPLPGRRVLFTGFAWRGINDERLLLYDPQTRRTAEVLKGAMSGRFVPPGDLVYTKGGALFASPFDPESGKVTGSPTPLSETVFTTSNTGAAQYAVSGNGTLAYVPGGLATGRTLVWRDRANVERPLGAPPRAYLGTRLSPDGSSVAVSIEAATSDVWVHHIGQGTLTRLTFEGDNAHPVWSPDGKRLAYSARREKTANLYWVPADRSGPPERLTQGDRPQVPTGFSPDGRFLAFTQTEAGFRSDIWVLPLTGDRKPVPLIKTPFEDRWARFSRDGKWIAWVSDETGVDQVYVQPFPGPGGKWQVSTEHGRDPVWGPGGRELFYTSGHRFMVVDVYLAAGFATSTPRELFEARSERPPGPLPNYDVSADGQRFLMVKGSEPEDATSRIHVVLNWFDTWRKPARR